METKHKGPMDPIAIVELATDINRVAASAVQTSTAHLQARIDRLEREKGELVEACNKMFKNKFIRAFYRGHKKMDMVFAEEVPGYKKDCESITKAFEAVIAALSKAEGKVGQ